MLECRWRTVARECREAVALECRWRTVTLECRWRTVAHECRETITLECREDCHTRVHGDCYS